MPTSESIYQRLIKPQYVENDGQRLVLDPIETERLMKAAAGEIKRLHNIIHGDGSWQAD